jgi:hypothetical protein
MNYKILGKVILKTFGWMIGGSIAVGVSAISLAILHDLSKPWSSIIVLSTICIVILGILIHDTYKKMIRKESKK